MKWHDDPCWKCSFHNAVIAATQFLRAREITNKSANNVELLKIFCSSNQKCLL